MTGPVEERPSCHAVFFRNLVPYREGCGLQDALVAGRLAGKISDTVLFLEHEPVITLGVNADASNVKVSEQALCRLGYSVERTTRGGDVTFHGPGQPVMYPILRLSGRKADVARYVRDLEETAIRVAADYGVAAGRRAGMPGVWTERGKIAAMGIRIRRWVTSHGLSFNVSPDLTAFDTIVPCGLAGESVTSLKQLLGDECPASSEVSETLARRFAEVFDMVPDRINVDTARDVCREDGEPRLPL